MSLLWKTADEPAAMARPLVSLRLANGYTVSDVLFAEGPAVPWAGRQHSWSW